LAQSKYFTIWKEKSKILATKGARAVFTFKRELEPAGQSQANLVNS
jgi:hypothetical protein